jgi:hypothetical protein
MTITRGVGPRFGSDAVPAGQDGVQIIVDRKAAAAGPVGVARGEPGDEPGHQGRAGRAARIMLAQTDGRASGVS